ncbi:uncharacterized protein Z518_02587 [Rhinocladiella mackenziei CBS 650.93]|uniref:Uncharacterized protein n=1 Tax=Rhinocladiella mackenziei CBS 650.93 TaxID=1442369 RepID=A0A0D2HBW0_9EURO|nr:uncharacterized protein Z518_02587 [Rhinocladiella mackenziei CBS 650.93]KIX07933.1 hypothetical protein Z518_02587 [Rhinocladiella mackenziei CBS 650.93]
MFSSVSTKTTAAQAQAMRFASFSTNSLVCNSSVITGGHLPLSSFPTMRLPDGEDRVQRITYLAEVRNRLLQPLEASYAGNSSGFRSAADIKFDKILFINDVFFNPLDAVQLLFSTNGGKGTAEYRAACAIDFVCGIMFYDSFVVRDTDGFGMGLMFYPWFTTSGSGTSRAFVQSQKDAVPVRSCWGGMAAFNASLFQTRRSKLPLSETRLEPVSSSDPHTKPQLPLRFRSSQEPFWEAAECCLIFADIEALYGDPNVENGTGVFINPYIRIAYSQTTWEWLPIFRRFERMFEYLQYVVSMIGYPEYNPRRLHEAGQLVEETVWVSASEHDAASVGHFMRVRREAAPGGFCGQRRMFVMKRDLETANTGGTGKNWEKIRVPPGAR